MNYQVLFASEFGNAEILAEDLAKVLNKTGPAKAISLRDIRPEDLVADTFYIFVCSTFGAGEVPEMGLRFLRALETSTLDLSEVKFAMFGLGDMTYSETYANGSTLMMQALLDKKAQMVGERGIHDASTSEMPEDIALPWLQTILPVNQTAA